MKILVTGANGFLGKNVCEQLAALPDAEIIAPSRKECDYLSLGDCQRAAAGVDCIIHLAVRRQLNDDEGYGPFYQNTLMALNIIEAARRNSVPRIISIGTILAYDSDGESRPTPPFSEDDLPSLRLGEAKRGYVAAKEALLAGLQALHQEHGTHVTFLILPNMFGKHDSFHLPDAHFVASAIARMHQAKASKSSEVVFHGHGEGKREFVYAADVAAAICKALALEGFHIMNMGSGDIRSPHEIAVMVADMMGYGGVIHFPPGKSRDLFVDMARIRSLFGSVPHTPLAQALRETIAWFETQKI